MLLAISILLLCNLLPSVVGHARVDSPVIRGPGQHLVQTCGQPSFNAITRNVDGYVEQQYPFNNGTNCQPSLCRGMVFADQPANNVQIVSPGQQVSMKVNCTNPHGGPANVSLIDTTAGGAGTILGPALATFDNFCPTQGPIPSNQTNLQFNLPSSGHIGDSCRHPGDCVVQLYWFAPDLLQSYFYCVDVLFPESSESSASSSFSSPLLWMEGLVVSLFMAMMAMAL